MASDRLPRKLAAILYADVAGYSRLVGEDEDATHRTLTEYLDLIATTIESHQGKVKHYAGDAVLAQFDAVLDAVACAIEVQRELQARNADLSPERRVQFRVGVNLGDVIEDRGDIYGDGVNVAARLESLAEPGGICISESVRSAIGKRLGLDCEPMGEQKVKNIAEPVRAYRVHVDAGEERRRPLAEEPTAESPDKPSIAVLPFTNMSGDPDQEYFSDGITEDIITELARFPVLFVIARHSSFAFKGQSIDLKEVGVKLGVQYLVEGSVRKAGNRVRITAQLIEAQTGNHLWAERYDRELADIFAVQDEVTYSIVSTLSGQLEKAVADRAARKPPDNVHAYEYVLRGNMHRARFNLLDNAEARRVYQKAIELDPRFAQAYAGLCDTYVVDTLLEWRAHPPEQTLHSAQKAVELDGNDSSCRLALAWAFFVAERWDEAEDEFDRILALKPKNADVIVGTGHALSCLGRYEEGLALINDAMRLNPLHPDSYRRFLGIGLYLLKRYEETVNALRGGYLLDAWGYAYLAASYAELGRVEEAGAALTAFVAERRKELESLGTPTGEDVRDLLGDYRKNFRLQADWDRLLAGLRKAGLPE